MPGDLIAQMPAVSSTTLSVERSAVEWHPTVGEHRLRAEAISLHRYWGFTLE